VFLLLCAVVESATVARVSAATSPVIYVGDGKGYEIAFKSEGGLVYALELDGTAHCYFSEPHEDVGSSGFNSFPMPKMMREGPDGLIAGESSSTPFGRATSSVKANIGDDAVTGTLAFDESEESYHCDTGFSGVPFEATRHEPLGSTGVGAPAAGGLPAYYGHEAPIEIFVRANRTVAAIRGAFRPNCQIGRTRSVPDRHALFGSPVFIGWSKDGGFRQHVLHRGKTRAGEEYKESISINGRLTQDAVTGTYLRIRTSTAGRGQAQRCTTGPLPFRAIRYLPVMRAR
jgi:hypothetical protein